MSTQFELSDQPASLVKLPMSRQAPGLARVHIRGVCHAARMDDEQTNAAVLVISELVTNAVSHVGSGMVTVEWIRRDDLLLIEVGDEAPHKPPRLHLMTGDDDEHGRGLPLVMMLTRQFVVLRRDREPGVASQKIIRVAFDCP
ncbi:ATP-binding protein [Embleya sp. NPDC050154]|uniref:ATP-binding protein n=1 Tax=unclassified Embleya TaxID=2699296 RepID=UPI0037ADD8D1